MNSPVMSFFKELLRAPVQLDPTVPKDNPVTPSAQASSMIASDNLTSQSLVLNPKAMKLVIIHQRLAQLPGYDPEVYTSLFLVDQIIDSIGRCFYPGWKELLPPAFVITYALLVRT